MERFIRSFSSKRNSLILLERDKQFIVRKRYKSQADLEQELAVYRQLAAGRTPHAELIHISDQSVDFSYLPGIPLAEVLESQREAKNQYITPWYKLIDWLLTFTAETGLIQQDCNLGNYLYNANDDTVVGIDFESCKPGTSVDAIGQVCAHILANSPDIGSSVVEKMIGYCCDRSVDIDSVQAKLRECRRSLRIQRNVAAVIVADAQKDACQGKNGIAGNGDASDLFHLQLCQLRSLGISEIYASGFAANEPGIVNLPDTSIHTALHTARKRNLLMLYMDAPLPDIGSLSAMLDAHLSDPACSVTTLYRNEANTPRIAVYTKSFAP